MENTDIKAINSDNSTVELVDSLDAYEQIGPELRALGDDEVIPINVDIMLTVTTVLGSILEIRQLRAELVEKLPSFDVQRFHRSEVYARKDFQSFREATPSEKST